MAVAPLKTDRFKVRCEEVRRIWKLENTKKSPSSEALRPEPSILRTDTRKSIAERYKEVKPKPKAATQAFFDMILFLLIFSSKFMS